MGMDSFKTGSGLADELTLEVQEAIFTYDAKIGDGQVPLLKLAGIMDGEKQFTETWSCGKDWVIEDGGARIVHKSGDPGKRVNKNSGYGRFLDGFVEIDGALKVMEERDGDALIAATWEGLTLHLSRVERPFTDQDGNKRDGAKLIPDGLGQSSTAPAAKPAAAAAAAAAPAPAPAAEVDIPAADKAKLTALAQAADNFETFIGEAYVGVPALNGADYESYVSDDGASGFFATIKG